MKFTSNVIRDHLNSQIENLIQLFEETNIEIKEYDSEFWEIYEIIKIKMISVFNEIVDNFSLNSPKEKEIKNIIDQNIKDSKIINENRELILNKDSECEKSIDFDINDKINKIDKLNQSFDNYNNNFMETSEYENLTNAIDKIAFEDNNQELKNSSISEEDPVTLNAIPNIQNNLSKLENVKNTNSNIVKSEIVISPTKENINSEHFLFVLGEKTLQTKISKSLSYKNYSLKNVKDIIKELISLKKIQNLKNFDSFSIFKLFASVFIYKKLSVIGFQIQCCFFYIKAISAISKTKQFIR